MMAVTPSRYHIPIGRENAITRAELMQMWHMDDRGVRETNARAKNTIRAAGDAKRVLGDA